MTKINNATNLKDEDRISRDLRRAATGPIAKLRRDDKLSLLSLTHTNLRFIGYWHRSRSRVKTLTNPWSQPLITLPVPSWKVNG